MKTVWKGAISFGLVSIPVKLYTAVQRQATGFKLLHREDRGRIRYKRVCAEDGREIPWEEIVKGLEIRKGEYVVFENEELQQIRPDRTETIEIVEFVDESQVDRIHFDRPYYVAPDGQAKAYYLLKDVLASTAKVAIGRFAIREKEHICTIGSYRNGLLLTTLNYAYEIRDMDRLEELEEAPQLSERELELAKDLVNRLYEEAFNIAEFRDTFAEELKELVKKKAAGEEVVVREQPRKMEEADLLRALEASLR